MSLIKRLAKWKVYLDRSRAYVGYINFVMILLLFLEGYKETAFGIWFYAHSAITLPVTMVIYFAIAIIVGYLDKIIIRPYEQREITSTNPIHMEVLDKVNKLLDKTK